MDYNSKYIVEEIKKILFYGLFGISGVILHLLLYNLLLIVNANYQLANFVGYGFGTALTFLFNRKYNFKIFDKIVKRLSLYFLVALTGYLISALGLHLIVEWLGANKDTGLYILVPVIVLVQYTLNRTFTFRTDISCN